jgi:hypothetical protein
LKFSPREFSLPLGDPRIWCFTCSQAYWDKLDPEAHKKVSSEDLGFTDWVYCSSSSSSSSSSSRRAYWDKLDPDAHKKVSSSNKNVQQQGWVLGTEGWVVL